MIFNPADLAEFGDQDLDWYFMLFEKGYWKLQERNDTFGYGVNLSVLICDDVFVIFFRALDHPDVLDVVFERGYWLNYYMHRENDARAVHRESFKTSVHDSLFACSEVGFQKRLMLLSDERGHQYVHVMALHFELGIAEELEYPKVGFHYLPLLFARAIHDDHGGFIVEHHLVLVLVLFHLPDELHLRVFVLVFFAFLRVVLNRLEVIPVQIKCVWVVRVDLAKLGPQVDDQI